MYICMNVMYVCKNLYMHALMNAYTYGMYVAMVWCGIYLQSYGLEELPGMANDKLAMHRFSMAWTGHSP